MTGLDEDMQRSARTGETVASLQAATVCGRAGYSLEPLAVRVRFERKGGESTMAIPDFQTIMLPLLKLAGDGDVHSIHEAVNQR